VGSSSAGVVANVLPLNQGSALFFLPIPEGPAGAVLDGAGSMQRTRHVMRHAVVPADADRVFVANLRLS
jgi:hypothetical protein